MEKRILFAFALSFLVFVAYMRFFAPPPADLPVAYPEGAEPAAEPAERAKPGNETRAEVEPVPPAVQEEPVESEVREAGSEQQIAVETSLYRAVFSNRGANLRSFVLQRHENNNGEPYEMVPRDGAARLGIHPFDVEIEGDEQNARLKEALFETSASALTVRDGEEVRLDFNWADGRGLESAKTVRFRGGSYSIEVEISVRVKGNEVRKRILYGPGVGEESRSGTYVQPDKGVIKAGQALAFYDAGDVEKGEGASLDVGAVGVTSHYFVALMMPPPGSAFGARLSVEALEAQEAQGKPRSYITAELDVPTEPAAFEAYVGPKDHDRLARLGPGMEHVIEYGPWMRYLALPLRKGLLWIHGYVGNYGWSIVLLTILINVALIPLKHHSYVSMRRMQKLAPQIKKIQERYKKYKPTDPKQQDKNKEIYALYREHNVSPMSGCLPMLLMIPFFFAFYRLLMVSIELRHAPFIFWIQDLATNDPYFVLPILMGVTQIAIQKMSPQTSADPVQAKMMMFLPVVFIFILAWAPAGLVLYWFVNNLVSIAQQTFTNRLLKNEENGAGKAAKNRRKQAAGS